MADLHLEHTKELEAMRSKQREIEAEYDRVKFKLET